MDIVLKFVNSWYNCDPVFNFRAFAPMNKCDCCSQPTHLSKVNQLSCNLASQSGMSLDYLDGPTKCVSANMQNCIDFECIEHSFYNLLIYLLCAAVRYSSSAVCVPSFKWNHPAINIFNKPLHSIQLKPFVSCWPPIKVLPFQSIWRIFFFLNKKINKMHVYWDHNIS